MVAQGAGLGLVALHRTHPSLIGVVFKGADTSLYANAFINVSLAVPADYPFRAPSLTIHSTLFHPQILSDRMCDDMLSGSWSPRCTLLSLIAHLRQALDAPDLSCAIHSRAADLFRSNRAGYDAEVRGSLPALVTMALQTHDQDGWEMLAGPGTSS